MENSFLGRGLTLPHTLSTPPLRSTKPPGSGSALASSEFQPDLRQAVCVLSRCLFTADVGRAVSRQLRSLVLRQRRSPMSNVYVRRLSWQRESFRQRRAVSAHVRTTGCWRRRLLDNQHAHYPQLTRYIASITTVSVTANFLVHKLNSILCFYLRRR